MPVAFLAALALLPAMPGAMSAAAAHPASVATTPKPIVIMAPGGFGSPADFNTTLASQINCGASCPAGSDLTMAQAFRNIGYNVAVLDFTAHPFDIALNAGKVRDAVDFLRAIVPGVKISLLSYSSGGWATRWYLRKMNGLAKIRTTVMLSAPHQGSRLSCFDQTYTTQYCRGGPQMMALNGGDDTPGRIVYTSIYSAGDAAVGASLNEPVDQNYLDGGACEGFLPGVTEHAHGSTHPQFILSAALAVLTPGHSNCSMTNRPNIPV